MSATEYARSKVLRLDKTEEHEIALALMERIERLGEDPDSPERSAHLVTARSLLERVSNP